MNNTMEFDLQLNMTDITNISTEVLDTYKKVKYGLKYWLWSNRNKKEIFKSHSQNGTLQKYQLGQNAFDWDKYNLDVWTEFSESFDAQTELPKDCNSNKEANDFKTKMILWFIEKHGHKVNLKANYSRFYGVVVDQETGITITHKSGVFTIYSPSKTTVINVEANKPIQINGKMPMVLPPKALPVFQKMLSIADLISKDPEMTLKTPYMYLDLEGTKQQLIQSAQEFLIQQNEAFLAKRNVKKDTQFSEALHNKKQIVEKSKQPIIYKDEESQSFDEKKPTYKWKNINRINGNDFYGVTLSALISCDLNIPVLWENNVYTFKEHQLTKQKLLVLTNSVSKEEITLEQNELVYITEENFQIWQSIRNMPIN